MNDLNNLCLCIKAYNSRSQKTEHLSARSGSGQKSLITALPTLGETGGSLMVHINVNLRSPYDEPGSASSSNFGGQGGIASVPSLVTHSCINTLDRGEGSAGALHYFNYIF